MYVFKKKQHITLFALIETEKKRREKKIGILDDGMVMYVECDEDDDERSPSFSLFPSSLIAFHCSLSLSLLLSLFVR
jgi:hypothetical protein